MEMRVCAKDCCCSAAKIMLVFVSQYLMFRKYVKLFSSSTNIFLEIWVTVIFLYDPSAYFVAFYVMFTLLVLLSFILWWYFLPCSSVVEVLSRVFFHTSYICIIIFPFSIFVDSFCNIFDIILFLHLQYFWGLYTVSGFTDDIFVTLDY